MRFSLLLVALAFLARPAAAQRLRDLHPSLHIPTRSAAVPSTTLRVPCDAQPGVGYVASRTALGGVAGTVAGFVTYTFGPGLLRPSHDAEARRARRHWVLGSAEVGAALGFSHAAGELLETRLTCREVHRPA